MAGMKPSFVTGANAKIKIGGRTFAYASDVSYQVSVDVIPIETMGRYEAVTHEPVNYAVAGEFSVVRYTAIARQNLIPGTAAGGNGPGNVTYTTGNQTKMSNEINPGDLLLSETWDMSVYQKEQVAATGAGGSAVTTESVEFISIKNCRVTGKGASLNKRGILVDRIRFVGVVASDDSFESSYSGDTDLV